MLPDAVSSANKSDPGHPCQSRTTVPSQPFSLRPPPISFRRNEANSAQLLSLSIFSYQHSELKQDRTNDDARRAIESGIQGLDRGGSHPGPRRGGRDRGPGHIRLRREVRGRSLDPADRGAGIPMDPEKGRPPCKYGNQEDGLMESEPPVLMSLSCWPRGKVTARSGKNPSGE